TQRSIERVRAATLLPPLEFDLTARDDAVARLTALDSSRLRPEVREAWERGLEQLRLGGVPPAIDLLAAAFEGNDATLLDYLPMDSVVVRVEPESLALQADQIALQAADVQRTLEVAGELPLGFPRPFAVWQELNTGVERRRVWDVGQSAGGGTESEAAARRAYTDAPLFGGRIDDVALYIRERTGAGWRVVCASDQSERLRDLLEDRDIYPRVTKRGATASEPPPPGSVDVVHAGLAAGFVVPSSQLVVLTDFEIFGLRKVARTFAPAQKRRQGLNRQFLPGGYVVHVEHGVGRFQGLVRITLSGVEREYLQIDYAEGDRLYVPVDQSDRLLPYESPAGDPKITRLSTAEWAKVKSRVRRAVREMAFELLQIYAAREMAQGNAFPPDTAWDIELEESFPFRETADQLKAIQEVRGDLETAKPMDRLICGDVGYGKTEVALRAAFKAANAGWQVAILVPTTVLALQHFSTFQQRLAAFPVRVEMLSRLRSKQEQASVVAGLRDGSVDIVIGTHRLVQKDVDFKRLGLLIVDEEQRFGVRHKEHIKQLRAEVHVLTMTATPIPRTLHLALTGIRDLSLITTPPQDRVPIRTFVTPSSETLIREAVLRELARGGQVYIVHNRVQSIHRFADELRELIPEARFAVAHGQMNEGELEPVVMAFVRHEFDVLVCTTIIESGVDIPNANTIIIDNAHALGLTQLYQLRGRVGRGTNRAYAYLLFPRHTPLSKEAVERLEAIQEATELGAGFQVALRDMEIRGAGNILGAEQSGHIAAVGFDLYARMLAHAVEEIRAGRPIAEPEEVTIDIGIEAAIPDSYIEAEQVRLETYRQIASVENERGLRDLEAELTDRFGTPPPVTLRLFDLVRLRHRASSLGLTSIVERGGDITMRPVAGAALNQAALRGALGPGAKVTPNQVRLTVEDLKVDRWTAVTLVLDEVERVRPRRREPQPVESGSSDSSATIARAASA
ncbi:MAG: transcription-repair coupling factor, partial [Chloroflexi bacterium]